MKRATTDIPPISREMVLQTAEDMSVPQVRFMVANYYMSQEMRKRGDMQIRHFGDKADEPLAFLQRWANVQAGLEQDAKDTLSKYVKKHQLGKWMLNQLGVGPISAAGLLAHIDITRAPTVGHIWSYAGLNPHQEWRQGEKRPYNPALKQVCYHLGQEFKKNHNKDHALYGKVYEVVKAKVVAKNEAGLNAERAKRYYTTSADVKKVLKEGKLPAGNLDLQACNQAVKIFLSHLHAVWYWHEFKQAPPRPFSIAIMGHAHEVRVPDMEMFPGFEEAYYGGSSRYQRPSLDDVIEAA